MNLFVPPTNCLCTSSTTVVLRVMVVVAKVISHILSIMVTEEAAKADAAAALARLPRK